MIPPKREEKRTVEKGIAWMERRWGWRCGGGRGGGGGRFPAQYNLFSDFSVETVRGIKISFSVGAA